MATNQHNKIVFLDSQTSLIEDTYLLAALLTFDPSISYAPVKNSSTGKVAFEVRGQISNLMRRLYEEEEAPLSRYISNLKALRSIIFAVKNTQIRKSRHSAHNE